MNVKLTYTTNIDDVPRQAANILLLDGITTDIEHWYSNISNILRNNNVESAIEQIHNLRIELAKIDIRLADVVSILDAYQKLKYTDNSNKTEDE